MSCWPTPFTQMPCFFSGFLSKAVQSLDTTSILLGGALHTRELTAEENAMFRLLRLHNVMPSPAAVACLSDLWNSTIVDQITDRNTTLLTVHQKSVWNAANKSQADALTCSQWKMCWDNSQSKSEVGQTLRNTPTNLSLLNKKEILLQGSFFFGVYLHNSDTEDY